MNMAVYFGLRPQPASQHGSQQEQALGINGTGVACRSLEARPFGIRFRGRALALGKPFLDGIHRAELQLTLHLYFLALVLLPQAAPRSGPESRQAVKVAIHAVTWVVGT